MLDTGEVPTVDLNADLGEGETVLPSDLAILGSVSSANLACGFHAGSRGVMEALCRAAVEAGVTVGAHVSYRDREGFGRRPLDVAPDRLLADLVEQIETLATAADQASTSVKYVKPHGALYHRMGVDREVAEVVVVALVTCGVSTLLAPPGSTVVKVAAAAGLTVAFEGFVDRAYLTDGSLVPRHRPGAVIDDAERSAARAVSIVTGGGITADDGSWVPLACDSLGVHGDTPGAAAAAVAVRSALVSASVVIAPFVVPTSEP